MGSENLKWYEDRNGGSERTGMKCEEGGGSGGKVLGNDG